MENGGVSSQSTTAPSDVSKSQTPIYSRELTLQAHFTFGTPSMAPVQYAHVTPTSTSSVSGRPLMASGGPVEHFRWGAEHGAQCSITCGREGLTMTYNAPSAASPSPALAAQHLIPCAICNSLALNRAGPPLSSQVDTAAVRGAPLTASAAAATSITTTSPAPAYTRSLMDLSRPGDQVATRSLTFSGSLDRATQRPQQQRPYGRRCKSTAHIILQNNELQVPRESRPHEFHSTLREEDAPGQRDQMMEVPDEEPLGRPGPEGRGRARHRGGAEPPYTAVGSGPSGGWERGHAGDQEARGRYFEPSVHHTHAFPPPCCPCQHCSALYSIVSTLTHDRPCPVCPHHHHHHHHHHHPSCSPHVHPHHTQGPPDYPPPGPVGAEEPRAPPAKSPTTRTFNSHRCYEDDLRRPERPAKSQPSHLVPQPKARTPSPKPKGRLASPARSPARSLSPMDRRAAAAEEQHPRTTPILPRRVPRMGAAAAAAAAASSTHATGQAEGGFAVGPHDRECERERDRGPRARPRQRPRTIHIDVYCSSSSEAESSTPSSPVSDDSLESGPRRPQAVVALGSKQRKKTELNLGRRHEHPLEEKASSFVYSRGRRHSHSGRRSAFITDDVLTLSSSPPPPQDRGSLRSHEAVSAPPTVGFRRSPSTTPTPGQQSPLPMPAPPAVRPATLTVPTSPPPQPTEISGIQPRSRHSSLSYLSSPLEAWEGEPEPELPSSALSWRGSEFETSTPRLTGDLDLPSPRPTSELSLSSLHEAFYEAESDMLEMPSSSGGLQDSPKQWRSPQLERQRYIQKGQEDRYREVLRRRALMEAERPHTATPPNVVELARLPAFSEFSKEELKVISKSLERRESLQAADQEGSYRLEEKKESFKPTERKDSNRLLEWMQQYKEQEKRDSQRKKDQAEAWVHPHTEVGRRVERADSLGSVESREFRRSTERRSSFSRDRSVDRKRDSSAGLERQGSLRSQELRELMSHLEKKDSHHFLEKKDSGRSLERKDSFKARDKREYYCALERRDSGRTVERRDSSRSLERRDSGRGLERRDSGRALTRTSSGRYVERRDSGRAVELRDSGRCIGRSDSGRSVDRRDSGRVYEGKRKDLAEASDRGDSRYDEAEEGGRRSPERKRSFLEQLLEREESSRSDSVEWQDVVSTVRRRLSACAKQSAEAASPQSPQSEIPPQMPSHERTATTLYGEETVSKLPGHELGHRKESSAFEEYSEPRTTTVGGRFINIGLFRHLPRFPFSQTVPVPASRFMEARTTCIPEERKFVRPQLFGELRLSYPKRRGIHFGPPRNPQCSCENCRSWSEVSSNGQLAGSRLRAWSLTDLGADSSGIMLPQLPGSYPGTSLSRNNSNASDSAAISHVGPAEAGGKQP